MLAVLIYLVLVIFLICANDDVSAFFSNYSSHDLYDKYPGYGKDWIFFPDGDGHPQKLNLVERDYFATKISDFSKYVNFYLYTRSNPNESYTLEINDIENLQNSNFDRTKKVKFITHGWMASSKSESCQLIKNAYLKAHDYNVIIVDWSLIATNAFYLIPKKNTKRVGKVLTKMIEFLVRRVRVPFTNIHLIGHSLGAHISGFAGAGISCGRIARITALDAALPGFQMVTEREDKLDATDAFFVDAIHTCAGALGYYSDLGNADFYPNSGMPSQPGCCCIIEFTESCSHGRAYKYFAESITTPTGFIGHQCNSWIDYQRGNCRNDYAIMGEHTSSTVRGKFYLETGDKEPFALGYGDNENAISMRLN